MWRRPPICKPQGTKFRPYSITILIFSYIGRFFSRLLAGAVAVWFQCVGDIEYVVDKEKAGRRKRCT